MTAFFRSAKSGSGLLARLRQKIRKSAGMSRKVRLCYRCNVEILGPFENSQAKPILAPMILNHPTALTQEQQVVLAAWITKLLMVGTAIDPENTKEAFTSSQRGLFVQTLRPLDYTWIWIAHFIPMAPRDMTFAHVLAGYRPSQTPNPRLQHHVSTGTIGAFAFQFLETTWQSRPPIQELIGAMDSSPIVHRWSDHAFRIWPPVGIISWPPPRSLDENTFPDFADRFGGNTREHEGQP